MCRAFPTMLKGLARVWFSRLTPNSISTFKELSTRFASHFIGGHRYKKFITCLMSIKQREDETLKSYIARFNKEALSIDEVDDKILVATFTNGLWKGKFLFSLYKNDPKTRSDVLYRATKYINMEDALLACEEKPKKRERQKESRQDKGRKIARIGDRREDRHSKPPTRRFASFTHWTLRLIKSWCRSKTKESWHSLASWRVTLAKGLETSTVISIVTTIMTHLTAMT